MRVSDITRELGYDMAGEDFDVFGVAFPDEAGGADIAAVSSRRDILRTRAQVVLVPPTVLVTDKTLLMTHENMDLATVKICELLMRHRVIEDNAAPVDYRLCGGGYYAGKDCRISSTAVIEPGAMVGDRVVIGERCVVAAHAVIGSGTILEDAVQVGAGSHIGAPSFFHYHDADNALRQFPGCGRAVLRQNARIGSHTVVQRGTLSDTVIGENNLIGNGVDVGHDVKTGKNCKIVSQTGIAGRAVLKDSVLVYGQCGIANGVVLGNHVVVKARTVVTKSVRDNETVYGPFGRGYYDEMRLMANIRKFFDGKEM
ncbi:MAG: hypothetical protein K2O99_12345 [Lachnospiraceae bacterium]|nr:hypothetical protein [Lachnospiraceae bacterium]